MALRSKAQILMEEWGTLDLDRIEQVIFERLEAPAPPTETWTTLKLPYQAPSCPPLPSWAQIVDATAKHSLHARNGLHPEAENILFLAEKCPRLRIPHVLAAWAVVVEGGSLVYCMMMDFIEGIPMNSDRFAELPEQAQNIICAKVSAQIGYLRSLPSEGYYGRVHRQGWLCAPEGIRTDTSASKSVSGPYNTYEEFTSAIYRAFELSKAVGLLGTGTEFPPKYAPSTAKLWSIFPGWNPHEPKFTWIDPKMTNLIARPTKGNAENEDWEVFLIDWECAGWYPAWVQVLQFQNRCGALIRDRSQAPDKHGDYPFVLYRHEEIIRQMLKDFDPNPDWERLGKVQGSNWCFF
ncbi:hypothetical protein B0J11DRAFT_599679 [Dendryphion nanum]|uniref:Aminoglycoside phosphotransferase domain-containing protein n=1 Tax=Dendryphion nanum TaxID=256645 RepID=A0A9P9CZT4_9PLEO|nr:hypothetical protein B0J11DRAFT_599679 [Dendryphion nanum]